MGLELASSALRTRDLHAWPQGDGHPVIVLPGFLAGPESTVFLRSHLRRLGYRAHDWRQGRNLGASPALADRLEDLLLELHDRYERRVSLVGWSAGGIYAREMARALPGHTRSVITLGSPFRGHPASTRAWTMYRIMNRRHLARMFTEEALAQRASPLSVPTTCIYSRTDGIVAWECCVSEPAPQTENIEVHATPPRLRARARDAARHRRPARPARRPLDAVRRVRLRRRRRPRRCPSRPDARPARSGSLTASCRRSRWASPLDSIFLMGETNETLMHVASMLHFTLPRDAGPQFLPDLVAALRASPVEPPWNLACRPGC